MTHNSKEMCVSEAKVEKIVGTQIELLNLDLTGKFSAEFEGIKKDLQYIKEQTTKTNSRTTKNEGEISYLKQLRASRERDCPFKDKIDILEEQRIASDALRDYLDAQEEKADQDREQAAKERRDFYHRLQGLGAIITVVVALLAFGVDVFEFIKNVFTR